MTKSTTLLWLDDERDPADQRWQTYFPVPDAEIVWVKTYDAFVKWVDQNGLPDAICFDHDLGEQDKNGFDAAKWLTAFCLEHHKPLPAWNIQSANPIGKENIISILRSFERVVGNG